MCKMLLSWHFKKLNQHKFRSITVSCRLCRSESERKGRTMTVELSACHLSLLPKPKRTHDGGLRGCNMRTQRPAGCRERSSDPGSDHTPVLRTLGSFCLTWLAGVCSDGCTDAIDWPACSPDLDPVKHLQDFLRRCIGTLQEQTGAETSLRRASWPGAWPDVHTWRPSHCWATPSYCGSSCLPRNGLVLSGNYPDFQFQIRVIWMEFYSLKSALTGLIGVPLARVSLLFYSKCNVIFNQKQGSVSLVIHGWTRQRQRGSGAVSYYWSLLWLEPAVF